MDYVNEISEIQKIRLNKLEEIKKWVWPLLARAFP